MARRDLYASLGIRKDASQDAIKRAYRKLAKALHPDLNRSKGATERFLAVKEAYEVLSNPLLRREYDEGRTATVWETPPPIYTGPGRVIRVAPPYQSRDARAVRVRPAGEDRKRRQLGFAYTAVTAGMSVVFLAGSFLLVALGGLLPGVVSFTMGLTLILLLMHVFPVLRPK